MIDALNPEYITKETTPYLFSLYNKSISGRLIPTFGFEPDSSFLAGLYPDEFETGAQFCYDPENSIFPPMKNLGRINSKLSEFPNKVMRRILKNYFIRKSSSPVFTLANIPLSLLQFFDFTMQRNIDSEEFLGKHQTIFKLLKKFNMTYFVHTIPNNSVKLENVVRRVEKELLAEVDFAFLMIGNLDSVGHKYGPDSRELKNELIKLDKGIRKIFNVLFKRKINFDFVLFGDHGMCKVRNTINIEEKLKKLPIRLGKDYLCFLDSTMARFWFFNEKTKNLVENSIQSNTKGHFITADERDNYHLNYKTNLMGESIYVANPGNIIYPNYYQRYKYPKGMHGYLPNESEQQSFCMIYSEQYKTSKNQFSSTDMRRLYPTFLKLIGIPNIRDLKIKALI